MDMTYAQRVRHLMNVAQGKEKAHLAVVNATLANVYSGELIKNQAVCVWEQWIAYVGPNPQPVIGPETTIIDAGAKPLVPGFIDGHTHMAVVFTADTFLEFAIPGGTTAIVTETSEPYVACGYDGVVDFMASFGEQPIHFFGTAPPMVSISSGRPPIPLNELQLLLKRTDMIGLGETYWQGVFNDPDNLLPVFETVVSAGKRLEGHTAGANEVKLNAYVATGISSCHEPIKAGEALDRLRLGLYVMIREGSIRRDLEEIATLRRSGTDLRRLILVTDSITPEELMEKGYMEYVVQKAIDCGFAPMEAIQMATLNPAVHFNLDHVIGGIAPGRFADMAILPDIRTIRPELVLCKGKVIAKAGKCLVTPRVHRFQPASLDSVRLTAPLTASDFSIPAQNAENAVTIRVMDMITDLVSREALVNLPAVKGEIMADPVQGIAKVAAINRTNDPGRTFVGLVRGFGIKSGALATSTAWDAGVIVAVGASEADMAMAVNRIRDLKGGVVVCRDGSIRAELALPIFGLLTQIPLDKLVNAYKIVVSAAHDLGIPFRDPIITLGTLTSAAIPFLRCCDQGLVNLKTGPCPLMVKDQQDA